MVMISLEDMYSALLGFKATDKDFSVWIVKDQSNTGEMLYNIACSYRDKGDTFRYNKWMKRSSNVYARARKHRLSLI